MTTTTPAPSAVADLATRLAQAMDVSDVIVVIDPAEGIHAHAHTDPCTGARRVTLGGDVPAEGHDVTAAVLAHEYAHHTLGHTAQPRRWYAAHRAASCITIGLVLAAAVVPVYAAQAFTAAAVTLVVSVAALLVAMHGERAGEYAADAESVRALDAIGLDGRAAVAASFRHAPAEPWWYRAGGWLVNTHPTTSARIRRIRANANARPVVAHRAG